jgi:cell division protein FtsN
MTSDSPAAAASPVTDSPPVAPGAPEAAESAAPPRTPEKAPENTPERAPAHVPEKNSDKGKKAVSPEQGRKAPEKAPAKETAKAPAKETAKANGTLYLLQTGLFSVRDNAAAEAARYRAKGYPGCVLEEGAGSRRRYRVIVGRFPDQGRATEARRSFVAREGVEAMVKEVPVAEASRRLNCR